MNKETNPLLERSYSDLAIDSRDVEQGKRSHSNIFHFYPTPEVVVNPAVGMDQEPQEQANSVSIFLTIFITFLSNVVFSIVLPSLPDYLKQVGAEDFLNGWAVAVNSLGTFLASPLFGYWADRGSFRIVFLAALLIMLVSNIWYALVTDMYQLFVARFFVGVAGASFAPASSYLSYATSPQERAKIMTWNAASSVLGFICGPSFSLLTSLPALEFSFKISSYKFSFNAQTAPGWVSALFAILGIICLIPFKEVHRKSIIPSSSINVPEVKDNLGHASMRSVRSLSLIGKTKIPIQGVLVCLLFAFVFTTIFTIFETMGPLYTAKFYDFAVFYNSLLFLGVSVLSLLALMSLQGILYFFHDERFLMVGFGFLMTGGLVLLFNWNDTHVNLIRFCVGIGIVSVGYANSAALLLALFSKLLEEREQGIMMGWLSSVGCIARMACPIGASYVYKYVGADYIFLGSAVFCFLTNFLLLYFWKAVDPNKGNIDRVT